jgi:hypothetical protein
MCALIFNNFEDIYHKIQTSFENNKLISYIMEKTFFRDIYSEDALNKYE